MFKSLKKIFIPHRDNDYKPHLFREAGVVATLLVTFLLFGVALSGHFVLLGTDLTALVLPKVLVDYANEDRITEKYNQLAINSVLEKAAQLKADDMAANGYFAHKSPDGKTPWYWFREAGYDFVYAGENLAVNFSDSVDVNKAWMNSPGHRANIMNKNFTEIGIATAEGMYQGRKTTFVVQLFGRPAENQTYAEAVKAATPKFVPKTTATSTKPSVATASSSLVLSESVSSETANEEGTELFVSVEKKPADTQVAQTGRYSSMFDKMLVSPKKTLSIAYLTLAGILLIGIFSMLFIELRRQHPKHIFLGIGLILLIIGLLYVYQNILFAPLLIV